MNPPAGGNDSPFAARTRPPFPGQGTTPAVPVSAPPTVSAPSVATNASPGRKSSAPILIGVIFAVVVAGAAGWFFVSKKATSPTPAVSGVSVEAPAPAAVELTPRRDAKADYEALASRAAALELAAPERAAVAEATLRASGGAYDGALASLGPIVTRRLAAAYEESAAALRGTNLAEHATENARRLRLALESAELAAKKADWAEEAARREEAISLVPAARTEIAARLANVGKEAVGRGDVELATYFYERALRLEPAQAEARAHLFAHKFKAGQIVRLASGIDFAYAPPGEFLRGSRAAEPGRGPDEEQATVRLTEGFFIGVTEVTQRQWDLVFGPGAAARALAAAKAKPETVGAGLPMHSVRWDEAAGFCEKLSALDGRRYRLPTEAEWEYACRAGTTTAFNLGADGLSASDANIDDGSAAARFALAPVGLVGRANAWGLRDLHGNVWEWCADWSAPYPTGDLTDPRGPEDSAAGRADLAMKVVRGGGWNAPASEARSANRWEYSPAVTTDYIGLRVVQEPELAAP